ncbi:ATP-dependent DNA ligase [Pseudonocardia endophytica]|uniref:ATP-dependent DNA ligase n=2 Tax=Pseudonocardia endophytica TaxID=401976 RepID=A0A4R1HSY5_PSEEN|nr:ATP-dependent DNA ligase [Pseudonocardia endophytica]
MPDLVPPMLPAAGELDEATDASRWAVEFAWVGHRCVAYARPGRVRLLSSTARSVTGSFPDLAPLGDQAPGAGMVLDGVVVALDEAGRPSRPSLMRRTATVRPDPKLVEEVPVGYVATDLLWCDGRRTADLPYRDRRRELEELGLGSPILVPPSFSLDEADLVVRTAEQYGLESLHLKRLDVPYQPGRRTRHWLRVPLRRRRQALVCGWVPVSRDGTRSGWPRSGPDRIAAVLLGLPGPDGPEYVGRVGLGASQDREDVAAIVAAPRTDVPPFRVGGADAGRSASTGVPAEIAEQARWLEPGLVALVEHRGRTAAGRLVLPSWLGLVAPDDIEPELESEWPEPVPEPPAEPEAPTAEIEEAPPAPWHGSLSRRLEQHFVYNTLNTIAALVRTDPPRARELLLGFADLSRAADRAGEASIRLDEELAAVRAYLEIEHARFGSRLETSVPDAGDLAGAPVPPLAVLAAVREAVQQWVEPHPEGGSVAVTTGDGECLVTAAVGESGEPVVVLALPLVAGPS